MRLCVLWKCVLLAALVLVATSAADDAAQRLHDALRRVMHGVDYDEDGEYAARMASVLEQRSTHRTEKSTPLERLALWVEEEEAIDYFIRQRQDTDVTSAAKVAMPDVRCSEGSLFCATLRADNDGSQLREANENQTMPVNGEGAPATPHCAAGELESRRDPIEGLNPRHLIEAAVEDVLAGVGYRLSPIGPLQLYASAVKFGRTIPLLGPPHRSIAVQLDFPTLPPQPATTHAAGLADDDPRLTGEPIVDPWTRLLPSWQECIEWPAPLASRAASSSAMAASAGEQATTALQGTHRTMASRGRASGPPQPSYVLALLDIVRAHQWETAAAAVNNSDPVASKKEVGPDTPPPARWQEPQRKPDEGNPRPQKPAWQMPFGVASVPRARRVPCHDPAAELLFQWGRVLATAHAALGVKGRCIDSFVRLDVLVNPFGVESGRPMNEGGGSSNWVDDLVRVLYPPSATAKGTAKGRATHGHPHLRQPLGDLEWFNNLLAFALVLQTDVAVLLRHRRPPAPPHAHASPHEHVDEAEVMSFIRHSSDITADKLPQGHAAPTTRNHEFDSTTESAVDAILRRLRPEALPAWATRFFARERGGFGLHKDGTADGGPSVEEVMAHTRTLPDSVRLFLAKRHLFLLSVQLLVERALIYARVSGNFSYPRGGVGGAQQQRTTSAADDALVDVLDALGAVVESPACWTVLLYENATLSRQACWEGLVVLLRDSVRRTLDQEAMPVDLSENKLDATAYLASLTSRCHAHRHRSGRSNK